MKTLDNVVSKVKRAALIPALAVGLYTANKADAGSLIFDQNYGWATSSFTSGLSVDATNLHDFNTNGVVGQTTNNPFAFGYVTAMSGSPVDAGSFGANSLVLRSDGKIYSVDRATGASQALFQDQPIAVNYSTIGSVHNIDGKNVTALGNASGQYSLLDVDTGAITPYQTITDANFLNSNGLETFVANGQLGLLVPSSTNYDVNAYLGNQKLTLSGLDYTTSLIGENAIWQDIALDNNAMYLGTNPGTGSSLMFRANVEGLNFPASSPVPEPATTALLGGLAALSLVAYRKFVNKKQ